MHLFAILKNTDFIIDIAVSRLAIVCSPLFRIMILCYSPRPIIGLKTRLCINQSDQKKRTDWSAGRFYKTCKKNCCNKCCQQMCYTRRKIEGGVGVLRESKDTNFLKPNGQSRNPNVYGFHQSPIILLVSLHPISLI